MNISAAGIALIKSFEGLRLVAYRCPAGVWTIGYGSTHYHDGKAVKPGDKLKNEAEADALLRNTVSAYVSAVNHHVKVTLNQNQFDALVSFTYNEGTGVMYDSTLVRVLNVGAYQKAADEFLKWNKITDPLTGEKVVLNALVKRRAIERALFLKKP